MRHRLAVAADPGIDHGQDDAFGQVWQRVGQDDRALQDVMAATPWVMSMISTSGAIFLMTPWQVPTKSSARPKSLRKVMNFCSAMTSPNQASW